MKSLCDEIQLRWKKDGFNFICVKQISSERREDFIAFYAISLRDKEIYSIICTEVVIEWLTINWRMCLRTLRFKS